MNLRVGSRRSTTEGVLRVRSVRRQAQLPPVIAEAGADSDGVSCARERLRVAAAVFLYPGQGSQSVGMGRAFHDASATARALFERADSVLGLPLTALCFEGPEADLRRTENAQPALFTVGAAGSLVLQECGIVPSAVAGHSAGEYAALMAAGALSFDDGLRAVRWRGELMAAASEKTPGTMAVIAGLSIERVEEICAAASSAGHVEIANENSTSQTVISGDVTAVERALDLAQEVEGAVPIPLAVSAAFHSQLMAPAAARMAEMLATLPIRRPTVPVVANITADYVWTPAEIRDALSRQITGRVRWSGSVRRLVADGANRLIEVGAGRALTGLARELAPSIPASTAEELLIASTSRGPSSRMPDAEGTGR